MRRILRIIRITGGVLILLVTAILSAYLAFLLVSHGLGNFNIHWRPF